MNISQKHTPGPWIIDKQEAFILAHQGTDIQYIASLGDQINDFGNAWDDVCMSVEVVANAHLIAAAPEMLAALESICTEISGGLCMNYTGATGICPNAAKGKCAVWDAIQKAKGFDQ